MLSRAWCFFLEAPQILEVRGEPGLDRPSPCPGPGCRAGTSRWRRPTPRCGIGPCERSLGSSRGASGELLQPLADAKTHALAGLDLDRLPGVRGYVTPEQAVAYVRSRHFETGANDKWTPDGRGDLGRVQRQQAFIKSVLQRAIDQGARNPLTANALIANATSAIRLDNTFSLSKLGDLAASFRSFDPASLQAYTVPSSPATIDKKAILKVDRVKAAKVIGKFGNRG